MKRLIVCCDGTWNKLDTSYPTNVVKIAQAIKPVANDGTPQILFYEQGLGTNWYDRLPGGAFGWGIDQNIQNAYRFLCLNYSAGDQIYLFGFSRGAYTVRSLAGLIRCSGGLLLRQTIREAPEAYEIYRDRTLTLKEKEKFRRVPQAPQKYDPQVCEIYQKCRAEAYRIYGDRSVLSRSAAETETDTAQQDLQRKESQVRALLSANQIPERNDNDTRQAVQITLLGCWDTVGALGIPNLIPFLPIDFLTNAKYRFHDTTLSSIVQHALHAVAIDEQRQQFNVTPIQKSPHASAQTLRQVWFPGVHGCVGGGSRQNRALSDAALQWMIDEIVHLGAGLELDPSLIEDGISTNPLSDYVAKRGIYQFLGKIQRTITGNFEDLHDSVKQRWCDRADYRPPNLEDYRKSLELYCSQR